MEKLLTKPIAELTRTEREYLKNLLYEMDKEDMKKEHDASPVNDEVVQAVPVNKEAKRRKSLWQRLR